MLENCERSKRRRESEVQTHPGYFKVRALRGHNLPVAMVKFSPNGLWLASGSADCLIKIWDILSCQCLNTLTGHSKGVNDVAWSGDSDLLVSGSDDKTVKVWDPESGTVVCTLKGHDERVSCCDIHPKSKLIVSGSDDGNVLIWDLKTGSNRYKFEGHSMKVTSIQFSHCGTMCFSASLDGIVRMFDPRSGECKLSLNQADNEQISSVRLSPRGNYMLVATLDDRLQLWDYLSPAGLKTYVGHFNHIHPCVANITISGSVDWVVSGSEDSLVYIWDLQSREVVQVLEGHSGAVLSTSCHPTQQLIASSSLGERYNLILWKSESNQLNSEETTAAPA